LQEANLTGLGFDLNILIDLKYVLARLLRQKLGCYFDRDSISKKWQKTWPP